MPLATILSVLLVLVVMAAVATSSPVVEHFPADAAVVRESTDTVHDRGLKQVGVKEDIVLKKNDITMVFAKRLAGAVWRMEYKGHLVIPELEGNGGSLQTALAFDVPIGESPEVENPTEAGNYKDNYGKTTSKWLEAATSNDEVYTKAQLAYYYPPGDKVGSSSKGTRGRGTSPLSDVIMKKRVTIGWKFPNVVNYDIELRWKGDHYFTQVQLLAVYLDRAFDTLYLAKGGKAVRHPPQPGKRDLVNISPNKTSYPIILAKSRSVAVGLYAHTVPKFGRFPPVMSPWYTADTDSGGHRDRGKGLKPVPLTAASAVWHAGSQTDTWVRIEKQGFFGMALVFGSVAEVAETIEKLSRALA